VKRKTFYTSQEVDCECQYDITFREMIDLIETCTDSEKSQIRDIVCDEIKDINCNTLYDEQKMKVLNAAFKKYDLDELIEKLNIKDY